MKYLLIDAKRLWLRELLGRNGPPPHEAALPWLIPVAGILLLILIFAAVVF